MLWRTTEKLDLEAPLAGARILLGAGLSPGISGVMARSAVDRAGPIERLAASGLRVVSY
jgi:saccharopine dehydrogenase-like NADP-dependent oxidoreductase